MKVEGQVTINGNISAVWTAITNIRDAAEIINSVEKIEMLNQPVSGLVGLKWRETRMYFGKPASIEKWITDAVENKFYTTRAEMNGLIFLTTMAICEHGSCDRLTSSHETKSLGILARLKSLPMIFFRGMLGKAIVLDLNDMKKAIEHK